jgi:hypothetical protein
VLQPLSLLRYKQATMIGVSGVYAAKLVSRIISATPARNMYLVRDALERYVEWYYPDELPIMWDEIVDSVDVSDTERFESLRPVMRG